MGKLSLLIAIICVSFSLGVCGADLLAAGPWWTSCQQKGEIVCPTWSCTYNTAGGINATCSTCDGTKKTNNCAPGRCGNCQSSILICCAQWSWCKGWDTANNVACAGCGVANYPKNGTAGVWYCQRKPSLWTLFASW